MGHAGAIISGGKGTAEEKIAVMRQCGISVVESPADIGITVKTALKKFKAKSEKKNKKVKKSKVKRDSKKADSKKKSSKVSGKSKNKKKR